MQGARISKDVSTAYRLVTPGEPVTYTLFVRNTASTAVTNVLITDTALEWRTPPSPAAVEPDAGGRFTLRLERRRPGRRAERLHHYHRHGQCGHDSRGIRDKHGGNCRQSATFTVSSGARRL
ncbi:MAG: DUF11 domain-containing protein [Chloroflexi bacterium]|nr:DUF11 domain-containing protein [Chloroflexota bacterium]